MKKLFSALFAIVLSCAPACAQWQVPNHSVPIGRGGGVSGFSKAAPGATDLPLASNGASADPSFRLLTPAGGGTGASNSTNSAGDVLASNGSNGTFVHTVLNAVCNVVPLACGRVTGNLHSKWYGALGNNSADDTAALQTWLTACATNGFVCFLDSGLYKVSSTLSFTGSVSQTITIEGAGRQNTKILSQQTSTDTFAFSTDTPILFSNFQIQGAQDGSGNPLSTAGALVSITSTGQGNFISTFRDMYLLFGFNAYNLGNAFSWIIDNNFLQAQVGDGILASNSINVDSGDWIISNTTMQGRLTAGKSAIVNTSGGGGKLANNKIQNWNIGYNLTLNSGVATSEFNIVNNNFDGVQNSAVFHKGGGIGFAYVTIVGNLFGGITGIGIADDSNAGWFGELIIVGNNIILSNGTPTAVSLSNTTNFIMADNLIQGNGGTPTGIVIGVGSSVGVVGPNTYAGLTTKYTNASTTTTVLDPQGIPFASLPAAAANGSQIFVTNGTPASSPCTGASTGSTAFRQNGAWKCF